MNTPTKKTVLVKDLVPYEHNDRIISEEAIETVATSIKAYGYNVPILVDANNVIIAGHTRRLALIQLGVKEIPVLVLAEEDELKKDKLRLLDNAISEAASWNEVKLGQELRMIQDLGSDEDWDVFSSMFEKDSALDQLLSTSLGGKLKDVDEDSLGRAERGEQAKFSKLRENKRDREVTCPKCGGSFSIRVYDY